ncbi:MAG: sulfotransferase [Chitinophagaceae bacterium]|nr:sulfotransferase [Chitinophagaceae bacterium]
MAKRKFRVAFSTIAAASFGIFFKLVVKYPVDKKYLGRGLLAGAVSLLSEPFRWIEQLLYSRKLSRTPMPESPVFILGHWRSGTTLLHNVLCKDEQFAFVTTYQSVFVNQFFASRWLFRSLMKWLMPEKRPSDNVLLSPDFPQEEGFALCNINSYSFYNYWYFPHQWKIFYDEYVSRNGMSEKKKQICNRQYKKLIAQSLIEHKRDGFISKNPANTGSIKQVLEMFPNAKFIYIYRNPLMVFQSTLNFFSAVMETLQLQEFTNEEMEEMIFELYEKLIKDYELQKSLIPAHHLIEIRYEEFLKSPVEHLKLIYSTLQLNGFEMALPHFITYLDTQKRFEKNKHEFDKMQLDRILKRWDFAMKHYGYLTPSTDEPA